MPTNNITVNWPPSAEEWRAIRRSAHRERARAMAATGRAIVTFLRRILGAGRPTTIYVPAVRGARISA